MSVSPNMYHGRSDRSIFKGFWGLNLFGAVFLVWAWFQNKELLELEQGDVASVTMDRTLVALYKAFDTMQQGRMAVVGAIIAVGVCFILGAFYGLYKRIRIRNAIPQRH